MNKDIVLSIPFFQNKPPAFVAAIGNLIKPIFVNQNDYIFMEGDPADESIEITSEFLNLYSVFLKKWQSSCYLIKI